jgi:hypothetical protein
MTTLTAGSAGFHYEQDTAVDTKLQDESSKIILAAKVNLQAAEMEIAYEITNGEARAAFVFAVATDGRQGAYPHTAYASLAEGCRELHLHLGECPVPAGVSLGAKTLPFAYRVEPGRTYSDKIKVPLPAREWDAYHGPEYAENRGKIFPVQRVVLTVECVLEKDTFFVEKVPSQEYFRTDGYPVAKLRSELRLTEPIPVLRRADEFPGF